MSTDYAVRFSDVSKRYRRGVEHRTLRDEIVHLIRRGALQPAAHATAPAVADLSFDISSGDSFALVGPNGAGKTTTLKLLTRVLTPTSGEIRVRGRVGALLEVGSGIHPELTGRENIWFYGQILGMTKTEVRARFDDIVEFAELGSVIDDTVKTYSTGMQLRLGFAVASHIDPDIFVIDEALSVGDVRFQAKCIRRMRNFAEQGRTLIYVSHNLAEVEALCRHGVFLAAGTVQALGDAREVLASYIDWMDVQRAGETPVTRTRAVELRDAFCAAPGGQRREVFAPRDVIEIRLLMRSDRIERPHLTVAISDGRTGDLIQCSMLEDGQAPAMVGPGEWEVALRIDELRLRPRLYEVFCSVVGADGYTTLMERTAVATFRVDDELGTGSQSLVGARLSGALDVDYAWTVRDGTVSARKAGAG